jgi:lysosomal-associated membrane protein 1/2
MIRPLLLTVVAIIVSGPKCVSADNSNTTTVAPTTPTPYADYWAVKDGAGHECIIFKANVTVAVKYLIDNSTSRSNFTEVDVFNAQLLNDSSCTHFDEKLNATVQLLHVSFYPPTGSAWELSFYFTDDKKHNDGKAFGLYKIELKADYSSFIVPKPANESETFTSDDKTSFGGIVGASPDHSSQCSTADLKIDDNAKVHLSPFAIQAYVKDGKLATPELCERDMRTSDIVPIVVGACLAALVIIVLVAYLIGRARAKRQGYASV